METYQYNAKTLLCVCVCMGLRLSEDGNSMNEYDSHISQDRICHTTPKREWEKRLNETSSNSFELLILVFLMNTKKCAQIGNYNELAEMFDRSCVQTQLITWLIHVRSSCLVLERFLANWNWKVQWLGKFTNGNRHFKTKKVNM